MMRPNPRPRPRPVVQGKHNPGVIGKGEGPVGNSARTVPKPLASTRSQAAAQMMQRYGKRVNMPRRTGDFSGCGGADVD